MADLNANSCATLEKKLSLSPAKAKVGKYCRAIASEFGMLQKLEALSKDLNSAAASYAPRMDRGEWSSSGEAGKALKEIQGLRANDFLKLTALVSSAQKSWSAG